jgi:hypothetical protein
VAALRALARGVGDTLFQAADPAVRRRFWTEAEHLAADISTHIDILTGELLR